MRASVRAVVSAVVVAVVSLGMASPGATPSGPPAAEQGVTVPTPALGGSPTPTPGLGVESPTSTPPSGTTSPTPTATPTEVVSPSPAASPTQPGPTESVDAATAAPEASHLPTDGPTGAVAEQSDAKEDQVPAGGDGAPSVDQAPAGPEGAGESIVAEGVAPAALAATSDGGLSCDDGVFYAVSDRGQLTRVRADGGPTVAVGSEPKPRPDIFNQLGIGARGEAVYATNFTGLSTSKIAVWRYDKSRGWENTGHTYLPRDYYGLPHKQQAGAVDLATGIYYVGGTHEDFNGYSVHSYTPGTGTFRYVGYVRLSGFDAPNGDMAFDADGNLYLVASDKKKTELHVVTRQALAAGRGGRLASSRVANTSITDPTAIVGIAFGQRGTVYLGGYDYAVEYNPVTWAKVSGRRLSYSYKAPDQGADLASCSAPSSVTVVKDLAVRLDSADQFEISLIESGSDVEAGTFATAGSTLGLQPEQLGPLPVIRGDQYAVREVMASGSVSRMSDYSWVLECFDETAGKDHATPMEVVDGAFRVPDKPAAVVECTLHNYPPPSIALEKTANPRDVNDDGLLTVSDVIGYTFVVRNTGESLLTGIAVTDPRLDGQGIGITCPTDTLQPSESMTCSSDAEYVVVESDQAAWEVRNTATVTGLAPGGVPVEDSDDAVVALQVPVFDIQIEKRVRGVTSAYVAGLDAEFQVWFGDPDEGKFAIPPVAIDDGLFLVENLVPGRYFLEETKAPQGYALLPEMVPFELGLDGMVTLLAEGQSAVTASGNRIVVYDVDAFTLPLTGGDAGTPFLAFGAVAMGVGAALLTAVRRRAR